MEEDINWKRIAIKSEPQLDGNFGDEDLSTGHHQESGCQVPNTKVEESSSPVCEGNDFSMENNLRLAKGVNIKRDMPNSVQGIKVECTKDEDNATGQLLNVGWHTPKTEAAVSSQGGANIKSEDEPMEDTFHEGGWHSSMIEAPSAAVERHPASIIDRTKVKSEDDSIQDSFHNVGWHFPTVETPAPTPEVNAMFSADEIKIKLEDDSNQDPLHGVGWCVRTVKTPSLAPEINAVSSADGTKIAEEDAFVRGNLIYEKTSRGRDFEDEDAKMKPEVESTSCKPAPSFAFVDCSRDVKNSALTSTEKLVIWYLSDESNEGCSKSVSPDQCATSLGNKCKVQAVEQALSRTLLKGQSQRNIGIKKNLADHTYARPFVYRQFSSNIKEKTEPQCQSLTESDEHLFSCDQCTAQFNLKNDLRRHLFKHFGEKVFSCDQCPAQFGWKSYLEAHLLTHSGKKFYSCGQCPAKFRAKSKLNLHYLLHSGGKAFSCDRCPAKFRVKSKLKKHYVIHSGEKAFSCDQCPAKFSRKCSLQRHFSIHSGEKAFSCDQCPAKFRCKGNLKRHFLIHSSEKCFPCDRCRAKFKLKSNLKRHFLRHSGKKVFSCGLCPAIFSRRVNFKTHYLTHSS